MNWITIAVAAAGAAVGWAAHAARTQHILDNARRDPVTGLPARALWTGQAHRILRGRRPCTVLLIDLDKFKAINDTLGHDAGDALLSVMATRLLSWTEDAGGGACGRLGGDEFVVITRRPASRQVIAALAGLLAAPALLPSPGSVPVSASVGAALCRTREDLPAALAAADAAMYRAKRAGGARYRLSPTARLRPASRPRTRARHHGSAGGDPLPPEDGRVPTICNKELSQVKGQ